MESFFFTVAIDSRPRAGVAKLMSSDALRLTNSERAEPRSAASMTVDLDSLFAASDVSSRDSMVNCNCASANQYGAASGFSPHEKAIRLPAAFHRSKRRGSRAALL